MTLLHSKLVTENVSLCPGSRMQTDEAWTRTDPLKARDSLTPLPFKSPLCVTWPGPPTSQDLNLHYHKNKQLNIQDLHDISLKREQLRVFTPSPLTRLEKTRHHHHHHPTGREGHTGFDRILPRLRNPEQVYSKRNVFPTHFYAFI